MNLHQQLGLDSKGTMPGLDFRIKAIDRLSEKISQDAEAKGINLSDAARQIHDVLRYTIVRNESNFTNGYFQTVEELEFLGCNVIRVKNTWREGEAYKGINTVVKSKEGMVFELQYHTPKSLLIKEMNHLLYEEQRRFNRLENQEQWDVLKEKMIKKSQSRCSHFSHHFRACRC